MITKEIIELTDHNVVIMLDIIFIAVLSKLLYEFLLYKDKKKEVASLFG